MWKVNLFKIKNKKKSEKWIFAEKKTKETEKKAFKKNQVLGLAPIYMFWCDAVQKRFSSLLKQLWKLIFQLKYCLFWGLQLRALERNILLSLRSADNGAYYSWMLSYQQHRVKWRYQHPVYYHGNAANYLQVDQERGSTDIWSYRIRFLSQQRQQHFYVDYDLVDCQTTL